MRWKIVLLSAFATILLIGWVLHAARGSFTVRSPTRGDGITVKVLVLNFDP